MRHAHTLGAAAIAALIATAGCQRYGNAANPAPLERASERNMGKPLALTQAELGPVYTEPGEVPQLQIERDGKKLDLPLEHTHVSAELSGFVGRVEVTQTYHNPFEHPLEAVYIFPLPENSAVDDMRMKIGDRVIVAEIQKRDRAKRTYEQAKRDGHTAALLEQERPNIFTQSVANIAPGARIEVAVSYLQTLTYDDGQYEFVFPMVVGPRFMPGEALDRANRGDGWAMDRDRVPDASRISPPILGGGERSGHDISLEVVAHAGLPIRAWEVPTHDVAESLGNAGSLALTLDENDRIPNRDFVLRYAVDGEQPRATLLTHANDENGGFFSLVIQPPALDVERLVGKRELIFVLDVSGSMHGVPLQMGKDAMRQALRQLRPVDTFNVITFAGRTGTAFQSARPANQTNLDAASRFIDGLRAGGGTHMLQGVEAALSPEIEPGRHRYVFFMTDGYIGNEQEIYRGTERLIAALGEHGQKARVFGYGLGSSVNRALLEGIARHGQGVSVYSSTREDPTLPVNTFFRYIDHPVLTDLEIDWGNLRVSDVFPTVKPDLFASRPTIVHGRYEGPAQGTIKIRGNSAGRARTIALPVRVTSQEARNASLATLWARSKIEDLERDMVHAGGHQRSVDAITQLGLDFRIVTAYTSFVAVDRSRNHRGELKTVVQPVEAPEGVNPSMAAPARAMKAYSGSGRRALRKRAPSMGSLGVGPTREMANDVAPAPVSPTTHAEEQEARSERNAFSPDVLRRALEQELTRVLRALKAPPTGEPLRLKLTLTLSRTGHVLQPRITKGADALDAAQKRAVLKALRRFRLEGARLDAPKTLELGLELRVR